MDVQNPNKRKKRDNETNGANKKLQELASKIPKNSPNSGFQLLSLDDISEKVLGLIDLIPRLPEGGFPDDKHETVKPFAHQLQSTLEQFNLLCICMTPATYTWSSNRSGAMDQNLSVLSSEISSVQDQISSSVSNKISNVLAPVVDLVISHTEVEKSEVDGENKSKEIRTNKFSRELVDPEFLKLASKVLGK